MAGNINAKKIHVGPGRLWVNICAPNPGTRLVIDANGNPTQPAWQSNYNYGAGAMVVDSNGNVQEAYTSGLSGGSAPTWATDLMSETTDGTVTWNLNAKAPAYVFAGASQGAANVTLSPKNNPITADQAWAAIDAVMIQEVESIEVELKESDLYKMQLYITHGTYGSGSDTALPSGVQAYEEIAFGGVATVPKMSVALISPRRDVVSKFVVIQLYCAFQSDQIQLPMAREKETMYKVKFEGLWRDWRPNGDKVGKIYRQT